MRITDNGKKAVIAARMKSNETEISDGYRERSPIEVEVSQSWENVIAQRVAVRCIVWLDRWRGIGIRFALVNEELALVWV
jgi:hypothetical protein